MIKRRLYQAARGGKFIFVSTDATALLPAPQQERVSVCLTGRCLLSRFSEHSPAIPSVPFLGIFQSGLCWSNLDDLKREKCPQIALCIWKASLGRLLSTYF